MKNLTHGEPVSIENPKVQGYDFNKGIDYEQMFKSYRNMGI